MSPKLIMTMLCELFTYTLSRLHAADASGPFHAEMFQGRSGCTILSITSVIQNMERARQMDVAIGKGKNHQPYFDPSDPPLFDRTAVALLMVAKRRTLRSVLNSSVSRSGLLRRPLVPVGKSLLTIACLHFHVGLPFCLDRKVPRDCTKSPLTGGLDTWPTSPKPTRRFQIRPSIAMLCCSEMCTPSQRSAQCSAIMLLGTSRSRTRSLFRMSDLHSCLTPARLFPILRLNGLEDSGSVRVSAAITRLNVSANSRDSRVFTAGR